MAVFARNLPPDYWIVSPRAPFATASSGYSWRAPAPRGSWPTIDLLRPAISKLSQLFDNWGNANNLDASRIDVAGFSQGGALTLTLGLLHPERIRKMGILAGFAPEGTSEVLSTGILKDKQVFISHGTADQMVPFAMALQMIDLLEKAGARVTFCESEVGHKLSSDCLKAFEHFLEN